MTDYAVVVAGGGPTGMMLAGELALAGVDVAIVERRADQEVDGSRAGGLYPRTIEVLDQRGIAERCITAGYRVPALAFAGTMLDISDFPTRHNYVLALWQREFEPILAQWIEELRRTVVSEYGTDFGLRRASWISRFTDMTRQAVSYRNARVLLAGDAAHIHPPHGGQGLNTGVQDAVNLGWKLAQVVRGTSPEDLLDTYHAERHPIGARAVRNTMAAVALTTPDDRHDALREIVSELLGMDEPRRHIAAMLSALDVQYELGAGHPLLGEVAAPSAVLVRPDGHVAWTGALTAPELPDALTAWFGAPAPKEQQR